MANLVILVANFSSLFFGFVLKLPQIYALYKKKDVAGMSFASTFLELFSYSIVMCYNIFNEFPIKNFAEYPVLVVQDMILIAMMLHYSKKFGITFFAFLGAYNAIVYAIAGGLMPKFVVTFLMACCTPLTALSKGAQLRAMWSTRQAQSISVLTWGIATYSCVCRLVTTVATTTDVPLITNFVVALFLNFAITVSAIYLQRQEKSKVS
ncbi:solute carrier family 66 member 3-like [Artemia franciscana]|uniref:solute carrier family 66 member 3-like n=1 Tax=Artemia franciscana TaxID=6661 RepID=UPI0032DB6029